MEDNICLKDMKFPKGCPKVEFYKHPQYCELVIYLFTKCNLNCSFCFQEHSADLNIDYIKSIPDTALELLSKDIKEQLTIKQVDVRILGGELFSDNIPDSYFELYAEMVHEIRQRMFEQFPDVKLDFIVTTNGVYKKVDRLAKFLEDNYFKKLISISIDFVGRYPNKKVKQRAYNTIKELAERGFKVRAGIVMTKRNIEYILKNPEEFKGLVETYKAEQIVFNFYIPNEGWEDDLPTDVDMWKLFKFCIINKLFYVSIVFYLFESYIRQEFFTKTCECKYIPTIMDGCVTKDCTQTASSLDRHLFYGDFVDEVTEENVSDVKASLGVTKRGCLSCEHYQYCPQLCWSLTTFKHFEADLCPLWCGYAMIRSESNKDLIDSYKKWKSENCTFC